jgi:transcriptional regulator of NAD metabolism
MNKNNYQVIVGNIGTVYDGGSKVIAFETYKEYVLQSKTAHMRASGETVVLLANGEIEKEHVGSLAESGQE